MVGLLVVGCLAAAFTGAGSAGALTTSTLTIVEPGTTTPLRHGTNTTPWGVLLPADASCPGDSATGGYRVYSYLVPRGVSPTQVSFRAELPSAYYGFVDYGAYFGAVNTAQGTGQIVDLPTQFTWTRLTPTELFPHGSPSTWEGGIACVDSQGHVTDVWATRFTFTQSRSDGQAFTWKVDEAPEVPGADHTGVFVGIGLLVVAAVAGGVATYLARRRGPADRTGPDGAAPGGGADGPDGGSPASDGARRPGRDHAGAVAP